MKNEELLAQVVVRYTWAIITAIAFLILTGIIPIN